MQAAPDRMSTRAKARCKVEVQFDQATLSKLGQEGAMMMLMTEEMTDPLAK